MTAVAAAQNDSADDIAFAENRADDLRIMLSRIIPRDLDGCAGWRIKQHMLPFIHDRFKCSGHRSTDKITLHSAGRRNYLIAVGDADNDLNILETAGLAIAVGNANEHVKAAAAVVVNDCDHDGCAEAIDKYLL